MTYQEEILRFQQKLEHVEAVLRELKELEKTKNKAINKFSNKFAQKQLKRKDLNSHVECLEKDFQRVSEELKEHEKNLTIESEALANQKKNMGFWKLIAYVIFQYTNISLFGIKSIFDTADKCNKLEDECESLKKTCGTLKNECNDAKQIIKEIEDLENKISAKKKNLPSPAEFEAEIEKLKKTRADLEQTVTREESIKNKLSLIKASFENVKGLEENTIHTIQEIIKTTEIAIKEEGFSDQNMKVLNNAIKKLKESKDPIATDIVKMTNDILLANYTLPPTIEKANDDNAESTAENHMRIR